MMNDRRVAQIDVLIPAYNAAATIEAAVSSIQRQSVQDIRIIIVNDGSTDNTGDLLNAMATADPRIKVIATPNGGIVSALNLGLAACTAKFIARHDADDLAFPDRLAAQIDYLRSNADCVAVGTNVWHIDQYGRRTGTKSAFAGDTEPDAHFIPSREPYLMHPFLMVRRQAIQNAGGYRYCVHAEDTDLYWRLLDAGRLYNLPEIHGEYRIHLGSISSASILNGRIAAAMSQLAAISYLRRKTGQADLVFHRDIRKQCEGKVSFERICLYLEETLGLSTHEANYLRAASAAKLLSLAEYRPYLPDQGDCEFITQSLDQFHGDISLSNKRIISRLQGKMALKLIGKGKVAEVLKLPLNAEGVVRAIVSDVRRSLRNKAASQ